LTKVCTFGKIYKLFVELNKSNTESYRSGHNGPDSKTNALFGSSPLKSLDFTGFFGYH